MMDMNLRVSFGRRSYDSGPVTTTDNVGSTPSGVLPFLGFGDNDGSSCNHIRVNVTLRNCDSPWGYLLDKLELD